MVPISDLPSLLLEKKDLAKHLGQSYRLEITRFPGTPPMVSALASSAVDVADLAFPTLPIAIQNAGISDLRVIADGFQDGVAGHYSNEYMVLTDGPIQNGRRHEGPHRRQQRRPAAASTSRCGRCCTRAGSRTNATTP